MNEHMIERWNKTISNKDTIYHLGDFAFGNKEQISEIVNRLNGRKILIKGNHCKNSSKWYMECGFDVALDCGVILDEYYLLTHKPIEDISDPYYNISGHTHLINSKNLTSKTMPVSLYFLSSDSRPISAKNRADLTNIN
jgi:calcineurin-like phosphoesterase family protein